MSLAYTRPFLSFVLAEIGINYVIFLLCITHTYSDVHSGIESEPPTKQPRVDEGNDLFGFVDHCFSYQVYQRPRLVLN